MKRPYAQRHLELRDEVLGELEKVVKLTSAVGQ